MSLAFVIDDESSVETALFIEFGLQNKIMHEPSLQFAIPTDLSCLPTLKRRENLLVIVIDQCSS